MRNCALAVILVGGLLFLSSVAQASLISSCSDSAFIPTCDGTDNSAGIEQYVPSELSIDAAVDITFTITTTVTNQSDVIWTGYVLTLDPAGNATFVEGSGGSTKFETINYPDLWTIEFLQPQPVLPGQDVMLQFAINISGPAPHTFTLSHNPIPEPATAVLLILGALALLARRRIKSCHLSKS